MKALVPFKTILLSTLLTLANHSPSFAAIGGSGPGGGGAERQSDGKLLTLAEAGKIVIRTQQIVTTPTAYPQYYQIETETAKELEAIVEKLPLQKGIATSGEADITKKSLYLKIIANVDTFLKKTDVPADELTKMQSDYQRVIESFGKKLDPATFVLTAFSKENKTYILKPFEKELTNRQQAYILIHEYFMREATSIYPDLVVRLQKTLELDALIYETMTTGLSYENYFYMISSLAGFRLLPERFNFNLRLINLMEHTRQPLLLSQISLLSSISWSMNPLDPSLLQNFENFQPGLTESLKGLRVSKESLTFYDYSYVKKMDELCQENSERLTNIRGLEDKLIIPWSMTKSNRDANSLDLYLLTCQKNESGINKMSELSLFMMSKY